MVNVCSTLHKNDRCEPCYHSTCQSISELVKTAIKFIIQMHDAYAGVFVHKEEVNHGKSAFDRLGGLAIGV